MKPEPEASDKIAVNVNKPAALAPKQPSQKGKVFDVMRPGRAPASPTSRPVIPGKNPVQNTLIGMSGIGDAKPIVDSKPRSTAPVDVNDEPQTAPDVPTETQAAETASAAPSAKVEASPAPAPDVTDQLLDTAGTPEESAPPAPDTEPAQPAPVSEPAARTAPETPASHRSTLAEEIDPLEDVTAPEDSPVVVSHHSSTASLVKIVLIIVVIAVLAVVAFDVMLDSGIVSVDGIPHTRLLPQ
ncbi:MAG TPA: hypothetical protein VLI54_00435 [Bacillota bacterium]|nr:hypothetical protein [Bacillota bacterium]